MQYPCTVCEKPVQRNQRAIICAIAVVSGHTLVVAVWERLNTCCLLLMSCEWFCPSCVQSKLQIASIATSPMLLQPKIDEVSSTLSDTELSCVSKRILQHSGSHSDDHARKRSFKKKREGTMKDIKQGYWQVENRNIMKTQNPKSQLHVYGQKPNTNLTWKAKSWLHLHGQKPNTNLNRKAKCRLHVYHMPKTLWYLQKNGEELGYEC